MYILIDFKVLDIQYIICYFRFHLHRLQGLRVPGCIYVYMYLFVGRYSSGTTWSPSACLRPKFRLVLREVLWNPAFLNSHRRCLSTMVLLIATRRTSSEVILPRLQHPFGVRAVMGLFAVSPWYRVLSRRLWSSKTRWDRSPTLKRRRSPRTSASSAGTSPSDIFPLAKSRATRYRPWCSRSVGLVVANAATMSRC